MLARTEVLLETACGPLPADDSEYHSPEARQTAPGLRRLSMLRNPRGGRACPSIRKIPRHEGPLDNGKVNMHRVVLPADRLTYIGITLAWAAMALMAGYPRLAPQCGCRRRPPLSRTSGRKPARQGACLGDCMMAA